MTLPDSSVQEHTLRETTDGLAVFAGLWCWDYAGSCCTGVAGGA